MAEDSMGSHEFCERNEIFKCQRVVPTFAKKTLQSSDTLIPTVTKDLSVY